MELTRQAHLTHLIQIRLKKQQNLKNRAPGSSNLGCALAAVAYHKINQKIVIAAIITLLSIVFPIRIPAGQTALVQFYKNSHTFSNLNTRTWNKQ